GRGPDIGRKVRMLRIKAGYQESERGSQGDECKADNRQRSAINGKHQQWPQYVELLFYRQRPIVSHDWADEWRNPVVQIEKEPDLVLEGVAQPCWLALQRRADGEKQEQRSVVDRENAQGSANIEMFQTGLQAVSL